MTPSDQPPSLCLLFVKYQKSGNCECIFRPWFSHQVLLKDIVSFTLTWKNEKRPSGPTELDLEADNLVFVQKVISLPWIQHKHDTLCTVTDTHHMLLLS